jgi:AcrR family transcriptional regulator
MAAVDHRRATAERNVESLLDAAERLMRGHAALSMSAVAAEAGVSRVTLYGHFPKLPDLIEAVVARSAQHSLTELTAAMDDDGDPVADLERLTDAAWDVLATRAEIARAAAEHLSPDAMRRSHETALRPIYELVARGRKTGAFRTDLPSEWLVTVLFTLVHAAFDDVRAGRLKQKAAHAALKTTLRQVLAA